MHRSATVLSLESSSFTSSSVTASSEFSARGIGSISGRAIYAIGHLALQGVEHVTIIKRIFKIVETLPNASAMDLKEVERLYKDLFELSRQAVYPDRIRKLALRTIFRQICSGETDYLVKYVNKYPLKYRKTFLEELLTMLDPLRFTSAKEGRDLNDVAIAYKTVLIGTEDHSLVPFIDFCNKLTRFPKKSTIDILLLESGTSLLDFLLHARSTNFRDPFAKRDPDASYRTSIFKVRCDTLLSTICDLEIEPAVYNHPIFEGLSSQQPPSQSSNRHNQTQGDPLTLPTLDISGSQLSLKLPPFTSSTVFSSASRTLVSLPLSAESSIVESPKATLNSLTTERPLPPLPFNSRTLAPTRLKINEFGSRFLPHTKSPIKCLLPLEFDSLLLIGHDDGLSVMNMFPHEKAQDGSLTINGPDEARARLIWSGQSVLQMTLLEQSKDGEESPSGAVLALVGPVERSIRIYNLTSLISLAKWAIMQEIDSPLDLRGFNLPKAQQSPSNPKHTSFSRGLKSLIGQSKEPFETSYHLLLSPSSSASNKHTLTPDSCVPPNLDVEWDFVDETSHELNWAKGFVSLAMPSSSSTVIEYALWNDERETGGCLLAVATNKNILLYECPAEKRKFQYLKTFPLSSPPRSVTFYTQAMRSAHPKTSAQSNTEQITTLNQTSSISGFAYGDDLCLFVVFDKRACYIHLSNSGTGKPELYDGGGDRRSTVSELSTTSTLRSRLSLDGSYPSKWLPPIQCTIPVPERPNVTKAISILTHGKDTHILPCPVPVRPSSRPPIFATAWRSAPTSISARVSTSANSSSQFLQLIALGGEAGLEVKEIPLSRLIESTKLGLPNRETPLSREEDLGGYTGFLCTGGYWDQSHHRYHRQRLSPLWTSSQKLSIDTETPTEQMEDRGVYGWCQKDIEDWRVFWVGGSLTTASDQD